MKDAAQVADRIAELSAEIRALTDLPPLADSYSPEDIIDGAMQTVDSALASTDSRHAQRIAELISESLALQLQFQCQLTARRSRMAATLMTSLRTLSNSTDAIGLPQAVCNELVAVAEFGAALYSVVESGHLRTLAGSSTHNSTLPIARQVIELPVGTVEYACVIGTAPLVADPTTSCAEFVELLESTAYVIFPVIVDSRVVAVVHMAHDPAFGIGALDMDVAETYQAAVTVAVARNTTHVRFDRQRATIDRIAATMSAESDNVTGFEIAAVHDGFGGGAQRHTSPPVHNLHIERELTEREVEIIRLIVAGASNADIADQLIIGRETVKTHVKRILRKIGAINRSEAITLYRQVQ